MIRDGTYDNRSAQMREYGIDGNCYDCHPAVIINAANVDQPHAVKPFGHYPEVVWQPSAWLLPETQSRVIKAIVIIDAFIHRMIKSAGSIS